MPTPFQKYLSGLSALLFPSICKGCGEGLGTTRSVLCRACEAGLPRTYFEDLKGNPVEQVFWGRTKLDYATALFFYRKAELLQTLIHHLKYKRGTETGTYLGKMAGKTLVKLPLIQWTDLMVPVPLHPKKQRVRGYNQAAVIAGGIQSETGLPVSVNDVIRSFHSDTQTRRTRYERWQNVEGIFKVINPEPLQNKNILILDDIVTTGATIEALCMALNEVPGVKLSVLTIGFATS